MLWITTEGGEVHISSHLLREMSPYFEKSLDLAPGFDVVEMVPIFLCGVLPEASQQSKNIFNTKCMEGNTVQFGPGLNVPCFKERWILLYKLCPSLISHCTVP